MPQLDSLRAFAVFFVFLNHYSASETSIARILPWGLLGVLLFFVLSGFLITGILLSARRAVEGGEVAAPVSIRNFFARRFLRLMPIYYLILVAAAVLLPHSRAYLWTFCLYSQNLLFASRPEIFSTTMAHFWTLAVEEQFYFTWPIVILFVPRRWLAPSVAGVALAGPLFRAMGIALGFTPFQIGMMMPAHFDTLAMGGLLAVFSDASESARRRLLSMGLWLGWPLLLVCLAGPDTKLPAALQFVLLELGAGLAFTWLVGRAADRFGGPAGSVLEARALVYLGTISYGLYVYHFNVPGVLRELVFPRLGLSWPESHWFRFAICAAVSVGIASLSWWALERPINGLKRRFPYVPCRRQGYGKAGVQGAPAFSTAESPV